MTTKPKKLKAVFDFLPLPADAFVSRLTAIHDKMLGNSAFPNPPVDLAVFMTAITTFAASVVVALDGSKQAKAMMKKQHEGLVKMAELLGHYVEATCNNEPATFTSSGFAIRSTTHVPPQPLVQPTSVRVDQGKTGQLLVILVVVLKARLYELRYAPAGTAGAAPTTFASISVASASKAVPVDNLTPGTTYVFQVRAFGKLGYTDWSQPVQRMVI
jgi:hypothetical protein